jgi:putative glutamine amidotransferase
MTIGFSKASEEGKYQLYVSWLRCIDPTFDYINFYGMDLAEALTALEKCSGLVLTGGVDVLPSYYGKGEDEYRCEIDQSRDVLEFALIEKALSLKLPLLAICRGEQILNVSQGGDLIVDIAEDHGKLVIHSSVTDQLAYHSISIDSTSILYKLIGSDCFDIVSVHHQAVKRLAPCFRPTAYSGDGIIEAFEWLNPDNKGYLMAVQWHPEKGDYQNALSQVIAMDFLGEANLFKK